MTHDRRTIAPNDYYSPRQLSLHFGIDPDSIEQARRNGKLPGIEGATGFVYMGADIFAWTKAGAPTAPATSARDAATTSHTSSNRSSSVMGTSNPTTTRSQSDANPIAEVARRVDALVLQGVSKLAAHERVMKNDSDLRCRYVVAVNKKQGRTQRAWDHAVANS